MYSFCVFRFLIYVKINLWFNNCILGDLKILISNVIELDLKFYKVKCVGLRFIKFFVLDIFMLFKYLYFNKYC